VDGVNGENSVGDDENVDDGKIREDGDGLDIIGDDSNMEVPPEEWARINRCGIALRKLKRIQIHDAFLDQYLGFLDAVRDALNHVPLGRDEGGHRGWWLETLQSERLALERDLSALDKEAGSSGLRLCAVQAGGSEQPPTGTDEVLQTMTVSLDVVRGDLEAWKPAMRAEYGSLINETSVIQPVKFGDLDQSQVEFVPGKLVCTVKPGLNGGRKKCRGVVCGNMVQESSEPTNALYASGADGTMIRAVLRHTAMMSWGITLTDIKTAFLHAPRPPPPKGTREVIVVPPKILVQAGICRHDERWRVHRALYGFQTSPALWAGHRDGTMKGFKWTHLGIQYMVKQTPEGNLWKIWTHDGKGNMLDCVGHVIVYVDDVLVAACEDVRKGFLGRLREEWATSSPEDVTCNGWVRFCGFELRWDQEGFLHVAQPSYTHELLERHGITGKRVAPMSKVGVPEHEENDITPSDIKAAQGIAGELLWLSVRSRPVISFSVGQIGRQVSHHPKWALQVGRGVLEYLASTPNHGLVYGPCVKDRGPGGILPIERHPHLIEAYSDISFAPQGGRSFQGVVILYAGCPLQWESGRQSFATMSTAESELLGYTEATTMAQSVEALLKVIHGDVTFEKLLCGDNTSAISILTKPDGPWRTRHLRLRSTCLKEKLNDPNSGWMIRHLKGTGLIADFLTKPRISRAEWIAFWEYMRMREYGATPWLLRRLRYITAPHLRNLAQILSRSPSSGCWLALCMQLPSTMMSVLIGMNSCWL
jgi:hypothetical protein